MPEAGRATVKFVGDYSALLGGLASSLAPGKLKSVGLKAGAALGAGFVGSKVVEQLVDAVNVTKDFDKELSNLKAISGATGSQMDKLRTQAIKLGAATTFTASEAAKAQTELAKGGLSASQIMGGALKSSLNLAAAGQLDLADAAETTVNAMQLFGLSGRDTAKIADMLATAANKTTADVDDFAMALKQGGSVAKLAGYDLNNTVTVLEALASAGIKNSDAGTSMKAAFLQLINPTKKQADLAKELGINWLTQNGELKRAVGISRELRKATDGMTKAERAKTLGILAGQDGIRTLNALYMAGEDGLRRYARENEKQGTAARTASVKMDNLSGDLQELSGAYETLQIKVGTLLTPALREATQAATGFVRTVGSIDPNTKIFNDTLGETAGNVVELGKALVQFPVDQDGGIKRFLNVFAGDDREVSRLQATMSARMDAAKSLQRVSRIASAARDRARGATVKEREAEADLRRARQRFGDGSSEVLRAEVRLQRAKRRTIQLTKEAKRAERLEGVERKVVASRTRDQVVQEKARLTGLNRSIRVLGRKWEAERKNNGNTKVAKQLEQQIIDKLKNRDATQKRLNNVLSDAARQIGPKYAKALQSINGRQATFESALGRLPKKAGNLRTALGQLPAPIEKVGRTSKIQFGKAETSVGDFADALNSKRRQINSNMRTMPTVQVAATDRMIEDFAAKVGAIKNDGKPQSKRRGGLVNVVRQAFRGGGVPVAVSPGEMFKTPDGKAGVVPGRPTAADNVVTSMPVGTKVFTFDGQRRLMSGESEASALRNQLPHFASGGIVKPEIIGGSPKARDLANTAIGSLHGKANEKLKKARQQAAAASSSVPGYIGPPADFKDLGNAAWVDAHTLAVGAYMANRFGVSITDGWRPQNASYGAPNSSHKRGTPNNPGALDFAPPSAAFQDFAGKHIAGLTENLMNDAFSTGPHNHLAFFRRGGIVGLLQALYTGGQVRVVKNVGKYLLGKGFDFRATSGILGNAYREALPPWNPASVGTGGGGLWGFTTSPVSLNDLQNYASSKGKSWDDEILQAQFMLMHGGMDLKGKLNAADKISDTARIFMEDWERPGVPALSDRIKGGYEASKILRDAGIVKAGDEGGLSDRQRSARQSKARRESREKRVRTLLNRGSYWPLFDMFAKYGEFDATGGRTFGGGARPGRNEATDFLIRAGQAASVANPNRRLGRLSQVARWLMSNVDMTGAEDANDRLAKKLERVQDTGGARAKKRREKVYSQLAGMPRSFRFTNPLKRTDRDIALYGELADIADQKANSAAGPGGSEYTNAELADVIGYTRKVFAGQNRKKDLLNVAIPFAEGWVDTYKREIKRIGPADRWKLPGYRKGLNEMTSTLRSLREGRTDLVGLSGTGGELFTTKLRLQDLGVQDTVEKSAAAGISIGDISSIVEAAKFGVYDNMPKFHTGGVFRAPAGQVEGPALLRDGERIFTPEQMAGNGLKLIVNGDIVSDHPNPVEAVIGDRRFKVAVEKRISESRRQSDRLARQGVGV